LLMSWDIRFDFRWHIKLYRDEQFLMEIGV